MSVTDRTRCNEEKGTMSIRVIRVNEDEVAQRGAKIYSES